MKKEGIELEVLRMSDRSFTEYVAHTFDNQLWEACEGWFSENKEQIEIDSSRIHKRGEVVLENVTVQHVWVEDLPKMRISFDIAVEVEYTITEGDYHYDDEEYGKDWFMIQCEGDLDSNLSDFQIKNVSPYDGKSRSCNPLSDSLVPYIKKEKLDAEAEAILRKYYPKALLEPIEIDPYKLASNMGLVVRMDYLTRDGSVFGRTYFYDSDAEFYNPETDTMYTEHVDGGTIIVDKQAYFLYTIGASHNTIIHECVHWEKHKKAVALARLYNESLTSIGCKVIGGSASIERDSFDWMEWQANSIAPKIQMPKSTFKKYIDSLISKYRKEMQAYDIIDIIEPIITDISVKFGVSKTSAKIRLLEIGRVEAQGAFIYVDGKHIPPHKSQTNIEINQTYSISAQDAAVLSMTDKNLQEVLSSGKYQYVESHYVLNHPKYIDISDSANTKLTHYARNHMDECCLLFDLSIISHVGKRYHTECFLNREGIGTLVDFNVSFGGGYQFSPDKHNKLLDEYMKWAMSLQKCISMEYTETMKALMKEIGVTAKEIGEETGLNETTVRRNINGETFKVETLVLILLGMHLPYSITEQILSIAPGRLMPNNLNHQWYRFALQHMYQKGIEDIQNFFDEHGVERL